MVQAPPWSSDHPEPAPRPVVTGLQPAIPASSELQDGPMPTIHEHTNDVAAIAALKAKQRNKARSPSFTSSPLTQRPLSPSAMSDSGSESSTSTARAIDIPRASQRHPHGSSHSSNGYKPYTHTSRRSITALTFGEALASSSSEDEKQETSQTTPNRLSPLSSSYKRSPDSQAFHHRNRRLSSSPMQALSVSPGAGSPPAPQSLLSRSHRRRSSGNYGNASMSSSVSSTPPASPSMFSSSFVGSYEASLLSGRMANRPSNSAALPFIASLGVLGLGKNTPRGLKCPDHIVLPFGAYFWDMDNSEKQGKGSPYVGTLDLEEYYLQQLEESLPSSEATADADSRAVPPRFPGYRIPPKGQIQLVVKNANSTAVKLFLVPYDLTDMPPGTKTFIRQKSYDIAGSSSPAQTLSGSASPLPKAKEALRYAVHLQFCAPPAKERERGRKKVASRRGGPQHSISASPRRGPAHEHSPAKATQSPARSSPKASARARSDTTTASHIYLHKNIRVVFTSRALDLSEKLKVVLEDPTGVQTQSSSSPLPSGILKDESTDDSRSTPSLKRYSAYTGPGEEWDELKKRKHALEKTKDSTHQEHHPVRRSQVPSDPNGSLWSGTSHFPGSTGSRSGIPLLNTPPLGAFSSVGSSRRMHTASGSYTSPSSFIDREEPLSNERRVTLPRLEEAADVPEPLTFQRSPVPATVPLPALMESGLSISRPGSRGEIRGKTSTPARKDEKTSSSSPERRGFGAVPAEGCLR